MSFWGLVDVCSGIDWPSLIPQLTRNNVPGKVSQCKFSQPEIYVPLGSYCPPAR
jgi:hypothetical protein